MGLLTTSNIQTLIRDLFHSPPSYKSEIRLSWLPGAANFQKRAAAEKNGKPKPEIASAPTKRHAPITFSNGDKKDDGARPAKQQKRNTNNNSSTQMYSPPGGKFSSKFGNNARGGERKFGGGGNRNNRPSGGGNRQRGGGGGRRFGGNAGRKSFRPY